MKATPDLNFTVAKPDVKSLKNFVSMIRSVYRNLVTVINGNIGFGDGTNPDNISGNWVNVIAPVAPNTDFTVTHNLNRFPVGYWVMQKDRACDVYTGGVASTKTQLTLRATVASAVLRLFIIGLLLGLAPRANAQTTVNLTVQDTPDNQTWNNGTWSAFLKVAAGQPPATGGFTIITGGGSVANQSGTLSGTGTASIALPANVNVVPANSVWSFSVCPQATFPCFQQEVTVVTSSPQTLTITPASIRINLQSTPAPVVAYADGELIGASLGSEYFNVTAGERNCLVVSGNSCTSWGSPTASTLVSSSANPAQTGVVRLASGDVIAWRNAANTGEALLAKSTAASGNIPVDTLNLSSDVGQSNVIGMTGAFFGNVLSTSAASGMFRLTSSDAIAWRNNANSADVSITKNSSDQFVFGGGGLLNPTLVGLTMNAGNASFNGGGILLGNTEVLNFTEQVLPSGVAGQDICNGVSTGHAINCSYNGDTGIPLTRTVASGTATMTTASIGSLACGTTVTVAATGVAATDSISWSFNAAPAANPGELVVSTWPTSNNVNFQYCNPTAGSVTPNAAALNWRVVR
jgi:hypothetical protein